MPHERISIDHRVMAGVPCIAGTRIPVATVVARIAVESTPGEILSDYPQLEAEDLKAALLYAAEAVRIREIPLARASG